MEEGKSAAQIFAENVAAYRKKMGFSQYELGEKCGLSRTMISHCEREGSIPQAEKLQTLADALEIPVYKLFQPRTPDDDPGLSGIDPRSVKKLRDILSLTPEDRNDLYRILNKLLRKSQLERQRLEGLAGTAPFPGV